MSDNEHTTASLGYSEILSVKNSVGEPIPAFPKAGKEGSKVSGLDTGIDAGRRKDAGDVLPNHPAGAFEVKNFKKVEGQVTARVSQSFSKACDAEALAGRSPDKKVNWSILKFLPLMDLRHIPKVWGLRVVVGQNRRGKGLDL